MTATLDQQLEEVLAALGEKERRQVLDFASSLRRERSEEEEVQRAFHEVMECMCEVVHRLRLVFEGDAPDHVVVIRGPEGPVRHYPMTGSRRPGFRPRGYHA